MEEDRVLVDASHRFGGSCAHNQFIVDEALNTVECGLCHAQLNPIWVLRQLSNTEARYWRHLEALKATAEDAKGRNRCKCEHCQQMTRIIK